MKTVHKITIKEKELEKFELVSIHWEDAYSLHNWRDIKTLADNTGVANTFTAGFLLRKTDKHYIVALSIGTTFLTAVDVCYIPLGMVRKVIKHGKIFKLNKSKRRGKPL